MEDRVYYKVVTKNRLSCSMHTYELRSLCRKYEKGSIVEAAPNTVGILCFETQEDAASFVGGMGIDFKILEVRGIGRKYKPRWVGNPLSIETINAFYYWRDVKKKALRDCRYKWCAPLGTICFQKVKVLT